MMTERFDLIPAEAIAALARRMGMGARIHGENNWRGGGEEFRKATINHLMKHLLDYSEHGNAHDENTAAIICNAAFLCHFEAAAPFQGYQPASDTDPAPPEPTPEPRWCCPHCGPA